MKQFREQLNYSNIREELDPTATNNLLRTLCPLSILTYTSLETEQRNCKNSDHDTTGVLRTSSDDKLSTQQCPGWWKQSFLLRLGSLVWFQVRATSCHLTSSKSAWKLTPKCTWMCWRVWWSPGAIRWSVADPGCGSRTRRRPTSPKRPRLGFRMSATTLYPYLTAPSSPDLNPLDYLVWSYVENITNMTSHNTKASLIAAIRRLFAELPPALVEMSCSQFRIRIEAVIEAEGGYIE